MVQVSEVYLVDKNQTVWVCTDGETASITTVNFLTYEVSDGILDYDRMTLSTQMCEDLLDSGSYIPDRYQRMMLDCMKLFKENNK